MAKTKQNVMITLDKKLNEKFNLWSEETLIPKSSLINKLLEEYLKNYTINEKK